MKRINHLRNLSILFLMLGSFYGCTSNKVSDAERSAEDILIDHCYQLDTTSIRAVLPPDSISMAKLQTEITADSWILIEEEQGLLIASKNARKKQYPASLTKMMTGKLVLDKGCLNDTVTITEDVFLVRDGMLKLGYTLLEHDLLQEMMLQSDNDAAYALATQLAVDTLAFCKMMNERASLLHMDSTHFANPNGMPNDSTYSSARDLLTLARYCMKDSTFAAIAGTLSMKIPLLDGRHLNILSTNNMLREYDGCIGIKTGYTRQAGGCLAVAAKRKDVTLFLVLLKSRSRSSRFTEAKILLDYGFRVMEDYRTKTATLQ